MLIAFYVFVCLFVCFSTRYLKNNTARITKLDVDMIHHESWKPTYFWVKRSMVNGKGHCAQKTLRTWVMDMGVVTWLLSTSQGDYRWTNLIILLPHDDSELKRCRESWDCCYSCEEYIASLFVCEWQRLRRHLAVTGFSVTTASVSTMRSSATEMLTARTAPMNHRIVVNISAQLFSWGAGFLPSRHLLDSSLLPPLPLEATRLKTC